MPAVAGFDTTDRLAEFGFKVANPTAILSAQTLAKNLVQEAVQRIDDQFGSLVGIGQNPYREHLDFSARPLRHAAPIELFESGVLAERLELAFSEPAGLPHPDLAVLSTKVLRDLSKHLEQHGYKVAASERHADGSLSRIAVVDPVYVAAATKQAQAFGDKGLAEALETFDAASPGRSSGILSLRGVGTAAEVQAFVDEYADHAVVAVREHLQGMVAANMAPFKNTIHWDLRKDWGVVVDAGRVRNSGDNHRLPQSAHIVIESAEALMDRVKAQFDGRASFAEAAFCRYLSEAIATRLRAQPDLRGALVGRYHGRFTDELVWTMLVVCGPKLPPQVPLMKRVVRALTPWTTKKTLALPAPVPTVAALPAPRVQSMGPYALSETDLQPRSPNHE